MIIFILFSLFAGSGAYTSSKYYDACKENQFKGESCKAAKNFSKYERGK